MKIGILDCDAIDPELQISFKSYSEAFENFLAPYDKKLKFLSYQVTREDLPERVKECDAYIVTGSRHSAYEQQPWIEALKSFIIKIVKHNKPLIGICFGHQVIAEALGGKVQKAAIGWGIGVRDYSATAHHKLPTPSWMEPGKKKISLAASHQDQVSELPENATLLLTSEYCPNAAYQIGNQVLTFQGHPEFSRDYLVALLNSRRKRIGESEVNAALETVSNPTNSDVIGMWIVNFIQQQANS